MTNRLRLLVLLTTGVVLAAAAGWTEPLVKTLDNGAQVIVEENHAAPVVAVRFYVGTGAAFEGKWLGAGISHFVEHCCDKGTPTRTAAEIEDLVQRLGNNANAYTSKRVTCYHITTASKFVGEAIDLLGDYVLGATFPPQEVEIQRGVILREIARGDDDPGRLLYNLFAETMFRRRGLGNVGKGGGQVPAAGSAQRGDTRRAAPGRRAPPGDGTAGPAARLPDDGVPHR